MVNYGICEVTPWMENQTWHDKTFHEEATWVPLRGDRLGCLAASSPIFPSSNIRPSAQHTNFKPHLKPKVTRSHHQEKLVVKKGNVIYMLWLSMYTKLVHFFKLVVSYTSPLWVMKSVRVFQFVLPSVYLWPLFCKASLYLYLTNIVIHSVFPCVYICDSYSALVSVFVFVFVFYECSILFCVSLCLYL